MTTVPCLFSSLTCLIKVLEKSRFGNDLRPQKRPKNTRKHLKLSWEPKWSCHCYYFPRPVRFFFSNITSLQWNFSIFSLWVKEQTSFFWGKAQKNHHFSDYDLWFYLFFVTGGLKIRSKMLLKSRLEHKLDLWVQNFAKMLGKDHKCFFLQFVQFYWWNVST